MAESFNLSVDEEMFKEQTPDQNVDIESFRRTLEERKTKVRNQIFEGSFEGEVKKFASTQKKKKRRKKGLPEISARFSKSLIWEKEDESDADATVEEDFQGFQNLIMMSSKIILTVWALFSIVDT